MLPAPHAGFPRWAQHLARDAASAATTAAAVVPGHHRPNIGFDKPDHNAIPLTDVFVTMTADTHAPTTRPTLTPTPGIAMPFESGGGGRNGGERDGGEEQGECRLLGSFAIIVQLALGGLALLSLVYKRWREWPQRPVRIWFFDVSKQVFGSLLVHIANVFMSLLTSGRFTIKMDPTAAAGPGIVARISAGSMVSTPGAVVLLRRIEDEYTPNPCSFYLLNLAIDTTVGIPILIALLRLTTWLVSYTAMGKPLESIQSGNYGEPPNVWWWLKQSVIYFCGLMGMKICVLIIFVVFPWISRIGDWALGWTEGNEKLQIVFVMMLFPLIMNAMQYYIIDSFIKKKAEAPETGERGVERRAVDELLYRELAESEDEGDSDSEDVGGDRKQARASTGACKSPRGEYDPAVDGDTGTVLRSSSPRTRYGKTRGGDSCPML